MKKKFGSIAFLALIAGAAFALGLFACSNGSDGTPMNIVMHSSTETNKEYAVEIYTGITNGSIAASPASATVGTTVTITASPMFGYGLAKLTVITSDGSSVDVRVTGGRRIFTMPAKNVMVTATFAVLPPAASGSYTKTGTTTINSIEYDLVTFGLWPQTIKAVDVDIYENQKKTASTFTYCRGSDGEWYTKIKESACGSEYKYSDGTTVAKSSANSYKWFKVEPIMWRVLTTDYEGTGKSLLLAENIIAKCPYYDHSFINRTVSDVIVYSSNWEHSKVRAFLNGRSYQKKTSDSVQSACNDFLGKGFLQTAFTSEELAIIQDTSVDNSACSTNPDSNATKWRRGNNQYASDTPTTDKVFLLSEQEATKSAYGFDVYDAYKGDGTHDESTRIRQMTDYAKANGAYQGSLGCGGLWWLRSPSCYGSALQGHDEAPSAYCVDGYGVAGRNTEGNTFSVSGEGGVVPALCVSN